MPLTDEQKQAALDELTVGPERDIRHAGQGVTFRGLDEIQRARLWARASGAGGPKGGVIGRGVADE